ncbi:lantibiotic dehydratase [Streptomyces sp. NPDC086554]|uniref:lantibiotic dehydratase n=1 Tax=Streptomyces sp. NPDC086554 TaxID=3154864 RepID=UPI0034147A38
MADAIRYQWTGAAILRATTDPSPADIPQGLDLDDAASTRAWLVRIWQRPDVRNALATASPVLCETVESTIHGTPRSPRQVRRSALSVVSYLLRWQQRPTPFGLFAGAAPLSIGLTPRVRWDRDHLVRLRADGEWINDVIGQLEKHAELLERLPIVANNTAYFRGDRLVAPGAPADGHARLMAPVEISVQCTRPVRAAMHAAQSPIRYQDLRDHLTVLFPLGAGGKIDAVLRELLTQNLLITSLRPPMTTVDALDLVCAELKKADAHSLPDVGAYARSLYDLRDALASHDKSGASTDLHALTTRMATCSTITPGPVLVDTILNGAVQLPSHVVTEAQNAVAVMHRLSPLPYGYHHWRDYHRRFRAQYGVGAMVPILDLVADSGLGLPAGYTGSERRKAPTLLTDRDAVILKLLQQTGPGDLVLDEATITELVEAAGIEEPLYADRCEVGFEVHAQSTQDLAQGEYSLEITSVPRPGSSMLGRFAHLLPADQQHPIADSYMPRPDSLTAQLSFTPRRRRNENVARVPQLLPYVIPLAEHPVEGAAAIALDDIGVTADARRLHLVQLSTGRPIDARVLHALEAGIQTPPLARFLSEVAGARNSVYKSFDFGAASRLPYLPCVRYGRTTLAPARWLLDNRDMPGRTASHHAWEKAFEAWRKRMNVSRYVCLMEYDQRLPLDLDHPMHRRLMRSQMYERPGLELRQAVGPDAHGWVGRAHDVVLPFVRSTPANPSLPVLRRHQDIQSPIELPGAGSVLQMHLHGHPDRFDETLDCHLPRLLAALEQEPTWWFTRHRQLARPETGQHLALNLHITPTAYAAVAAAVNRWAAELHHQRLLARITLEPYRPQTGRYGARAAMDAAHDVFAADSAAALAQIRLASRMPIAPQAVTAASLVDLAAHLLPSAEDAWRWLIENTPAHGRPERAHRAEALQLYAAQGGADLAAAWAERGYALARYRQALSAEQHDPGAVLRSLLHQHHVRALGVDAAGEAATLHLARTVALRHQPIKATR